MRSMTGFGRASGSIEEGDITVEIKTVNNRYLDINLKLPSELQQLESDLKRCVTDRLARGRIEVSFQYDRSGSSAYEIDLPVITAYVNAMQEIRDTFGLSGEPDMNVIVRLPNAVSVKRAEVSPAFAELVSATLKHALEDLDAMRAKEGSLLADDLNTRLETISARLAAITAESANITDEYRQRLEKRIGDILAKAGTKIEVDPARLAQEVAYLADRSDISEEIARLGAHIEHFKMIMADEKDVGKRLDFLTQELNREANTISSKTGNLTVKDNALAIKSEIEKLREQVQNIE
ncbi:MAG: YicC family protein [Acidobacteria bacterium]|nr:YicC family protein [Acidobacteriota bacterium]